MTDGSYEEFLAQRDFGAGGDPLHDQGSYQQFLKERNVRFASETAQSVVNSPIAPDEAAESLSLSGMLGVSPAQILAAPGPFRDQIEHQRATAALRRSPRLTDWMAADPINAAIARDDIEGLSLWESAAIVPRGMASAVPAFNEGAWGFAAAIAGLFGDNAAKDFFTREALVSRHIKEGVAGPSGGWFGRQVQGASQSVGLMAPGIAATVATGGAASPAVMASYIAPGAITQGGQSSMKALERGLPAATALRYGLLDSAAEVIFERLPVGRLLGDIAEGSGFGRILARQLAVEVPSEIATTLYQNLNEYATLDPEKPLSQFLAEQPAAVRDTIAQTVLATVGVSGAGAGASRLVRYAESRARAAAAEENAALLDQVSIRAQSSKVRERSPERFRQAVSTAIAGTPAENIYVPAAEFAEYFQSLDINPATVVADLEGVSQDDLAAAIAAGGDLRIPTATYAARIAGSEHDAFIRENMRFDPSEMTRREAEDFNQRAEEVLEEAQAAAQAATLDIEAEQAAAAEVYDRMVSQFKEAGQTADVADKNARVWAAFMQATAARVGQDVGEFAGRLGVRVQRAETAVDAGTRSYSQGAPIRRGSIMFAPGGPLNGDTIISLFESADLSTALHESGHFFLEATNALAMEADAPQALRDDMAAVRAYLGAEEGATFTVEQHETFARSLEAYMLEGKAPSLALADVFARIRAWLTMIYRSISGLNVSLTPEIRAVFDRMLATEAEIAEAQEQSSDTGPVFTTAEEMGLTQEEYDRFIKLREQAEAETRDRMARDIMEPIRREREKWFREERAKVRDEVRERLQQEPVYRAIQELRFGKEFSGEPAAVPKLDRASIERDYGADYITRLPGVTKLGRGHPSAVFSNAGEHPDIVAGIYGFGSGRELLDALASAPPIGEAIAAETDRIMEERHGDVLRDGDIQQIAQDAVHSGRRAEWLAAELKAVAEVAGVEITLTAKEARLVAKQTIESMQVKDAIAASRFLAAERKAGREAQELARRLGRESVWMQNARRRIAVKARNADPSMPQVNEVSRQIDKANASTANYNETVQKFLEVKRRQLLNHALYMEARDARAFLEKVEDKAAKLNRPDSRQPRSRDVNFVKAARNLAARFGLARPDAQFDFDAWMQQLQIDNPIEAAALGSAIQTYGRDAKPYRDISYSELSAVNDAIDSLMEQGKQAATLVIEGRSVEKAQVIEELSAVLEARGLRENPAMTRELTDGERRINTFMGWASALRRVENWARAMDGGEQGAFTRYLVRGPMEAIAAYRTDKGERLKEMLDILNPLRDSLTGAKIPAPELGFEFKNKAQVIHAILHTGNQSNMAKLLIGYGWSSGYVNQQQAVTARGKPRFRRDGTPVMTKGELDTSRWDAFLDRMIAEGTITAADIEAVNAIWDLMEKVKRPAQSAHKRMFGFYFKEIEPAGYDTAAGRLKGGYVPAILNRDATNDGVLREGETALDQQSAGFMLPTAGKGFTQQRVESYQKPLALDLMLLPSHLDKVLRFTHLDPAVRQVHSLVVDRRFGDVLASYDRTLIDNMLLPWLQRVAQQSADMGATATAGRDFNRVLRTLRARVGINTMFGNVVNVLQQFTGLSVANTLIKASHMKNAAIRYATDTQAVRDEVFALSPFMRDRVRDATRETQMRIQDVVTRPSTYAEFQQWAQRHGYFMQQAVQNWIDVPVWAAAYDQAVANGMTEADAVFEADATIRRTMGGMNPEDISMFESGPAWKRIFTMFYTYFNGQANHLAERGSSIWRQYGWNGARHLGHLYVMGLMIPAVAGDLIAQAFRGGIKDDDDDGIWDELLELFFGSQFKYGTAAVPVAGQLMQLAYNRFNKEIYDDRLQPSPVMSAGERLIRAPFSIGKAALGDGDSQTAIGDGLNAFALVTGIPANWLAKPMGYAAGMAEGKYEPEGPWHVVQGALSGRDATRD